jgi:restriction system protein
LSFVLTAAAVYLLLQARARESWQPEEEIAELPPVDVADPPIKAPAHAAEILEQTAPAVLQQVQPLVLEELGQAALERLCIALYQFNGLSSRTIATGVDGYRIRLVPRNTDKAMAILQCRVGDAPQGVEAYAELLRAMEEDGVEKAFFVAPAGFVAAISAEARSRHVTLVDAKLLHAMLDRLPDSARIAVIEAAV